MSKVNNHEFQVFFLRNLPLTIAMCTAIHWFGVGGTTALYVMIYGVVKEVTIKKSSEPVVSIKYVKDKKKVFVITIPDHSYNNNYINLQGKLSSIQHITIVKKMYLLNNCFCND